MTQGLVQISNLKTNQTKCCVVSRTGQWTKICPSTTLYLTNRADTITNDLPPLTGCASMAGRVRRDGERGREASHAAIATYTTTHKYILCKHVLVYQHVILHNVWCVTNFATLQYGVETPKWLHLGFQAIPKGHYLVDANMHVHKRFSLAEWIII